MDGIIIKKKEILEEEPRLGKVDEVNKNLKNNE